jgi:putative ABC transport system permease protein
MVLGVKPEDNAIELPGLIANAETIKKRDVLLFDEASRPEFGAIPTLMQQGKTVETEIDSQRIEVGGLFKLGSSFGADGNVIMSDLNFARLFQKRDRNLIDAGLIRTNPGMTPEQIDTLIAEMKKALPNDVTVLTKAGFTDFERSYWRDSTSIGFIFTLGAAMGFIVGIVVVYQILYTDVTDHLAEYATLKAMGYTNFYLLQVVFQEAFILSILGYLPGLLVCNALYDLVRNATSLPMLMTPERILQIFLLALVMCTISGAIAVRKVQEADPADIF